MPLDITLLHGITPEIAGKLRDAALTNSDRLLAAIGQPDARKALADKLSIDPKVLLELGNRADLARIRGIGSVYSDLLEFAGVDTVAELSRRVPENLLNKIKDVAGDHHVQRVPNLKDVQSWVAQAKDLDRKLHY